MFKDPAAYRAYMADYMRKRRAVKPCVKPANADVKPYIKPFDAELEAAQARIAELETEGAAKAERIRDLEAKLAEAQAEIKDLENKLIWSIDPTNDPLEDMAELLAGSVDCVEFLRVFKAAANLQSPQHEHPETKIIPVDELKARGRGGTAKTKNPFGALEIGEAFISPNPDQGAVSSLVYHFRKTHPDMQFSTCMTDAGVLVTRVQ